MFSPSFGLHAVIRSRQPVPLIGEPGAAAHVPSSWRENSCDSDPEGGGGAARPPGEMFISKHSGRKRKPRDISGAGAGGPRDKQHVASLDEISECDVSPLSTFTLTPV